MTIKVGNTTEGYIYLFWGFRGADGAYKERSCSIHPRAKNYEITFSCEEEKKKFLKEKEHLFISKKLTLGNQDDKAMNKEREKAEEIEEEKTQSVQNASDELVRQQVENITQGEVVEFEAQAVKNQSENEKGRRKQ